LTRAFCNVLLMPSASRCANVTMSDVILSARLEYLK
jgi:hypothetical protein